MQMDRYGWDSAEILLLVTLPPVRGIGGGGGGTEMGTQCPEIMFHFFNHNFCCNRC